MFALDLTCWTERSRGATAADMLTLETHELLCSARGVMFYRGQRESPNIAQLAGRLGRWPLRTLAINAVGH